MEKLLENVFTIVACFVTFVVCLKNCKITSIFFSSIYKDEDSNL